MSETSRGRQFADDAVHPGPGQFKRLKPGDPFTFDFSHVDQAQAFVQRQAFARYLVALVEEFPEVRAELRRLLLDDGDLS